MTQSRFTSLIRPSRARLSRVRSSESGPIRVGPQNRPAENDSPLEGDGFELSVPGRETVKPSWETGLLSRKRERICWGTEGSNPSPSSGESDEPPNPAAAEGSSPPHRPFKVS